MSLTTDEKFTSVCKNTYDGELDLIETIRRREVLTREELVQVFDIWVEKGTYDTDQEHFHSYRGPRVTAEVVSELFDSNHRKNIRILDMAAGTGLLSRELRKFGFKNIDGVDPSEPSKDSAMKEGLYERYLIDFVDDHQLDIESETYDCVVSTGGFGAGLMPCSAIQEFIRVAKIGGKICFSVPVFSLTYCAEYRDRLEPRLAQYEESGVWQCLSNTCVESYMDNTPGRVYSYIKLKSV